VRTLQAFPHYTDANTDDASFGTPPNRMSARLKTAIGCAALLALAAGTALPIANHFDQLESQKYKEQRDARKDATGDLEAHWQAQVGRSVRLDVRDGSAFGEIVRFEVDGDDTVDLFVRLVFVDDGTGSREPKVNIGGRDEDVGEGDEVSVSPAFITFVEPADVPKRKPTLGGLSEAGDAQFRRILGDRLGNPLSEDEKEKALEAFRTWVMAELSPARMRDLVAAKALLKGDAPAK